MKISTTITKRNFEMKMEDLNINGYFIEYKEVKPFWNKRLDGILRSYDLRVYGFLGDLPEIVFLVGDKPHWFKVVNIIYTNDIPPKYKDSINTEYAYGIKCISKDTVI
jgi:hypothetical protein